MKSCFLGLLLVLAGSAGANAGQGVPRPTKFQVNHADPYLIVALLEGRTVVSPELSTLFGFMGVPPEAGQALNRLFKGKFIVNATDNAIWFFPDPPSP